MDSAPVGLKIRWVTRDVFRVLDDGHAHNDRIDGSRDLAGNDGVRRGHPAHACRPKHVGRIRDSLLLDAVPTWCVIERRWDVQ